MQDSKSNEEPRPLGRKDREHGSFQLQGHKALGSEGREQGSVNLLVQK